MAAPKSSIRAGGLGAKSVGDIIALLLSNYFEV